MAHLLQVDAKHMVRVSGPEQMVSVSDRVPEQMMSVSNRVSLSKW